MPRRRAIQGPCYWVHDLENVRTPQQCGRVILKRDVAISIIQNLHDLMALDPNLRTDKQKRAMAKLKTRIRDSYNARKPETLWWDRDVSRHPMRRQVLDACIAYVGVDVELKRINDARREARRATKQVSTAG